jgi:hypothetical protein
MLNAYRRIGADIWTLASPGSSRPSHSQGADRAIAEVWAWWRLAASFHSMPLRMEIRASVGKRVRGWKRIVIVYHSAIGIEGIALGSRDVRERRGMKSVLRDFSAGLRIRRLSRARRRVAALFGVVALLFQAILSAWHHHTHPLPLHGLSAIGSTVMANGDPAQPFADDDCAICFALGHHTAVPVDFFARPLAYYEPSSLLWAPAVTLPDRSYLLFRSRAPPLA